MPASFVVHCGSPSFLVRQDKSDPQPIRGIDPSQVGAGGATAPAKDATGSATGTDTQSGTTSTGSGGKSAPPADSMTPCLSSLPLLIGMFALMYLLVIRPQQKQEKARRELLSAIKKGDKVITNGGIHGEVDSIDETTVTIRCAGGDGVKLKLDRSAIGRLQGGGNETATAAKDAGGSKA